KRERWLAHTRPASEAGAKPCPKTPRRDGLEGGDCRGLRHRMAVARNEDRCTNADAGGLLGDACQGDPNIMTERGDLGAPDALIAKLLCCHGVGDCVRTRRKTKCVGEHIRSL